MLSFPAIKPINGGFAPYAKSLSGGQSLSGAEQVTSQLNDRWIASYAFAIRKDADVLTFRAFIAAMRGRANSVALPAFDLARAPYIPRTKGWPLGTVTASPTWFVSYGGLEETPYHLAAQAGIGGSVTIIGAGEIHVTALTGPVTPGMWVDLLGVPRRLTSINVGSGSEITASVYPLFDITTIARVSPLAILALGAALNATTLSVSMIAGSAPKAGQLFSIGTRLYTALSVAGSGPYSIAIWPSLREATLINAVVNFASPICEMRFASDTEGVDALSSLNALRFSTITLKFDEVAT